jgi:UDP-N-acetylmuramate: L-alanyl-gamma-D-glutamyl-meso-diaminopimelate ligase
MHIHILGICGTFMGGLAALAREAGHRVTGCDANVYPPMSDQLRALGIELIEGYGADQIALASPTLFVVGNVVTRGATPADGGACSTPAPPYTSGPQWLHDHVLQRPPRAGRGRHARQDDDDLDAGLDPRIGRPGAGFPGRWRADELRRVGAAGQRASPS